MKKIYKQISAIAAVALGFIAFNTAVFNIFTKPCLPDRSEGMQAKSVELDRFLPFDENSEIVSINSDFCLEGELPVIDSAAALYPVSSAFVNAVYPEDSVNFNGKDFTSDSKLQMRNTISAYKAVVDGDADIILCAKPSQEQLKYAEDKGVELELVPIGCEAFVFLVNGSNPVDNLSIDEIKGIYSGKYTNWSQLGGENIPINPVTRNEGSGSQTALESFMGDTPIKKNPLGFIGSAIGFSFRYYVEDIAEHGNIKMLSLNGVYPDKNNIAEGNYPIVSNFYAVYSKSNTNPNIEPFISWMLSSEGQEIIEKTGYIPLTDNAF